MKKQESLARVRQSTAFTKLCLYVWHINGSNIQSQVWSKKKNLNFTQNPLG